jgi:hypothetical protein
MGIAPGTPPRDVLPPVFRMCPHCATHRVWERKAWSQVEQAVVTLWWCYHCSWEGPIEATTLCRQLPRAAGTLAEDIG